jgi:ferredoxin
MSELTIVVDRERCEGLGMCEAMADDYFQLDDDDTMTILDDHPSAADRDRVHAAVEACPVMALRLLEA